MIRERSIESSSNITVHFVIPQDLSGLPSLCHASSRRFFGLPDTAASLFRSTKHTQHRRWAAHADSFAEEPRSPIIATRSKPRTRSNTPILYHGSYSSILFYFHISSSLSLSLLLSHLHSSPIVYLFFAPFVFLWSKPPSSHGSVNALFPGDQLPRFSLIRIQFLHYIPPG